MEARTKASPSSTRSDSRGSDNAPRWTLGQIFARDVDDSEVDLDQRYRLDRRVLEQFLGRSAVTAADDQGRRRRRVRDRGDVNEILVVVELVLFRRHEVAVEAEQRSERGGIVHLDGLERRLEVLELARRADEKARIVGQILGQHARQQIRGLFLRHRSRRGGWPGISCAAAAVRPASRGTAFRPWPCCRSCNCRRRRRS